MQSSKTILIGGIVIISIGVVNAAVNKRPETPVFVGGIGFILLASLLDTIGGQWSKVASGLVGLAVVTSLLVEGPALFTAINNAKGGQGTETGSGSSSSGSTGGGGGPVVKVQ